jgi:hypothetical protein
MTLEVNEKRPAIEAQSVPERTVEEYETLQTKERTIIASESFLLSKPLVQTMT